MKLAVVVQFYAEVLLLQIFLLLILSIMVAEECILCCQMKCDVIRKTLEKLITIWVI
jgi:hypothetical protein